MVSRSARLLAALFQSDRRRLAAGFLAPLLFGLSFGCGYVAALSVGATDAITPVDQPLVATVDHGPARLAAPQLARGGLVVRRCFDVEVDPLRPVQDRAPPALAS
jgi:hypothetical protein